MNEQIKPRPETPVTVDHANERVATIVFDVTDPPEAARLHGDVAATDLVPRLEALLARLKLGSLRLPLEPGGPWVDDVAIG